ncbi:PAAR domain-containing protein [Kitasatospora sp. NBC_00315]|uniref:PAAR domain-containing protein n=1 Tax=Kitasatospora sp. NBC_00315 TaxID=2975963 RepID=UPI0032441DA3
MPQAARLGDTTSHTYTPVVPGVPTGTVGPPGGAALPALPVNPGPLLGVPSVRIGGRPAAVVGTVHTCSLHMPMTLTLTNNLALPALAAPVTGRVLIGGFPAARKGDRLTCQASVSSGAPTVFVGGR